MRFRVLQILFQDYFEDPSGNSLRWQKLPAENYHSNEINSCLRPKLKSADNVHDREKRLTTFYVRNLLHMYLRSDLGVLLYTLSIFASYSVCTTVAWVTSRWAVKFVDEVESTVFHGNIRRVFATGGTIT